MLKFQQRYLLLYANIFSYPLLQWVPGIKEICPKVPIIMVGANIEKRKDTAIGCSTKEQVQILNLSTICYLYVII